MIKKFIKEMFIFVFAVGLSRVLPFLLTPIFTHYMLPQEMGVLEIILAAYNIVIIFGMLQIDTAVQRFFYENENIAGCGLAIVSILSLFITAPLIIFSKTISFVAFGISEYYNLVIIAALTIPFVNIFTLFSLLLRYSRGAKHLLFFSMLQTSVFSILSFILVIEKNMGAYGYLLASLISFVLPLLPGIWLLKSQLKVLELKKTFYDIAGFAFPQVPARVASALIQYGNRFLILAMFTKISVGVFGMANKFSVIMMVFLSAFNMVWYPILYKGLDEKESELKLRKIFNIVLAALPMLLIAIYIINFLVFNFVVADEYKSGLKISYIITLSTSLLFVKEMVDAGIKVSKKVKYITYIYFYSLLVMLFSAWILGRSFGLEGVAYGMLCSNVFMTITTWSFSNKLLNYHFSKVNFWICLVIMLGITVIAWRIT